MIEKFITISELYKDHPAVTIESVRELLSCINRNELISRIVSISNIISHTHSNKATQCQIAKDHIEKDNYSIIDKIANENDNVIFFFRGQLYEAIDQILQIEFNVQAESLESDNNYEKLFKALLICSELWGKKTYKTFHQEEIDPQNTSVSFRKGIEYSNKAREYYFMLAKMKIIYSDIFPSLYGGFEDLFEESLKLSIEEYITCITFILLLFNHDDQFISGGFKLSFLNEINEKYDSILTFFNNYSIKVDDLRNDKNVIDQFLHKPFIEIDNTFYIADYINFLNISIDGPVFKLIGKRSYWIRLFGTVIEKYVIQFFKRIYPTSPSLAQRLFDSYKYSVNKASFEIDAIIENADSHILVEIKNAFLPIHSTIVDDPEKYLEVLCERYGVSKDGKKKGIAQLHRSIIHYEESKLPKISKKKKIFPVLIVNDSLIASPLTNKFILNEFNNLFDDIKILNDRSFFYKTLQIYPITIISVREIEFMERSINEYGFSTILNEFNKFNTTGNSTLTDFFAQTDFNVYSNPHLAGVGYEEMINMGKKVLPEITKKIMEERNET